jgi:two-component system, NarL family, nitrate/nitrite response regulator NarL
MDYSERDLDCRGPVLCYGKIVINIYQLKDDEVIPSRSRTLGDRIGMRTLLFVGGQLARERVTNVLAGSILTLIGEAETLAEAHRLSCGTDSEAEYPDILLVDIHESLDGDEADLLRAVRDRQPATKIVVLGDALSLAVLWQAHSTAIDGYLLHCVPSAMLMHALDLILSGQCILPPCSHAAAPAVQIVPAAPMRATATNGLSAREAQILQLLVSGSSNKAIARDLTISHETVKVHIRALLRKLKARNRTQAALWGLANGFRQVGCLLLGLLPFSALVDATSWAA